MPTLQELSHDLPGFENFIASSSAMRAVSDEVRRTAPADATVLLTGESGTGKEMVAEAIHRCSRRWSGPFLNFSLAAIPESLVESELFGDEGGVAAGGPAPRLGRLEAAHGGTLFLDDISDLGLAAQAGLLRALEQHEVTPVGSRESRPIDVRVIAATSRNLEALVAEGKFREDLYYRLSAVTIALPPLRQRFGDIPLLVGRFLDEFCRSNGKVKLEADPDLMHCLESYEWPGNVRQLRSCVESMVVLAQASRLTVDDLPAAIRSAGQNPLPRFEMPQGVTLAEIVKAAVLQTLDRLEGNRTQAAQSLGISVRTLQRKLKQWQSGRSSDPKAKSSKEWETIGSS